MQLRVTPIADASAVVATTNYGFTSDFQRVKTVQAVWTATTVAGTITLQLSLDNATWADFAAGTAISNASGNVMWNVDTKDALYWRVNWLRTSGTLTTLKAFVANQPRS